MPLAKTAGDPSVSYSAGELFARLIKREAGGDGENGMITMETVFMNRVNVPYSREGQGDLRRIISALYEFTCMHSTIAGQDNRQAVRASRPNQIHCDIADRVLSVNKHRGAGENFSCLNPFSPACPQKFPHNMAGVQSNCMRGIGSFFRRRFMQRHK